MTELPDRLNGIYNERAKVSVTPARIQKFEKGEEEWSPEDIYNNLDPEVILARFTSGHGNEKPDQRRRFWHDARRLLRAGYKPQQLIQLNESCINKNGTINEEEFEKLLKGEEEI